MGNNSTTGAAASTGATARYANILLDYWFKRSFSGESGKRLMIMSLRDNLQKVKTISDGSANLEKFCYALHNMTALKSPQTQMRAEIFELLFIRRESLNSTQRRR